MEMIRLDFGRYCSGEPLLCQLRRPTPRSWHHARTQSHPGVRRLSKRYALRSPLLTGWLTRQLVEAARTAAAKLGEDDPESLALKRDLISMVLPVLPIGLLDHMVTNAKDFVDRGLRQRAVGQLPQAAPELWDNRKQNKRKRGPDHENAVQFCRRVYSRWIAAELLTNEVLYALDPALLKAVRQWVERHPTDTILGLKLRLPSLEERIARLSPETSRDELIRLGSALNKEKMRFAAAPKSKSKKRQRRPRIASPSQPPTESLG